MHRNLPKAPDGAFRSSQRTHGFSIQSQAGETQVEEGSFLCGL